MSTVTLFRIWSVCAWGDLRLLLVLRRLLRHQLRSLLRLHLGRAQAHRPRPPHCSSARCKRTVARHSACAAHTTRRPATHSGSTRTTTALCRSTAHMRSQLSWHRTRLSGTLLQTWPSRWSQFTGKSILRSTDSLPTLMHETTRTSPTRHHGRCYFLMASQCSVLWPIRLRHRAHVSPRHRVSINSIPCTQFLHVQIS
jgi:hypothetical protein